MPKSVKAFAGLGVLYVLFGAALLAWYLLQTMPEQAKFLASLPPAARASVHRSMLQGLIQNFAIPTTAFALLAGFAAFARQNWARWGLAIYFVLLFVSPFASAMHYYYVLPDGFNGYYGGWSGWWMNYLNTNWLTPRLDWPQYFTTAVQLAFIVLIFSPNARPWFRAPAPE